MKITVLGSCAAWPEPGRACAGFLVEHAGFRLVMDLGFGTLPRLLSLCPNGAVDAVLITHQHSDHCVDLNGLLRVRHYGERTFDPIPLLCPPGVASLVDGLEPAPRLAELFEVQELPGTYKIGPFEVTGMELPHHVPNVGVRLTTTRHRTIAYTGDTGPSPLLAELGRHADLYIMDATLQTQPEGERHVLSALEAGYWAREAEARRLLLTHFWPGNDRGVSLRQAASEFNGELLAAEEGLVVDLD
ncbi:MBL fold metallo-hydrolase [Actinophytocola oryzae]|uniref:Ribonuclease BN (tRNA processing enzyme) n=1 Tax=Actinophytocola oryzae TaxID=502181 RepID=A0A4R7UZ63_9PSEU|nr:MBL fold metallo-hydrolase [Actinophytocola oryzae]TDV41432.1 ribonuclease BN (tRNA processing enzyme) [Actinophytocola oryzae]